MATKKAVKKAVKTVGTKVAKSSRETPMTLFTPADLAAIQEVVTGRLGVKKAHQLILLINHAGGTPPPLKKS